MWPTYQYVAVLLKRVSCNNLIYESKLRNDINFKSLFQFANTGDVMASSVFSLYLLKTYFSSREIKEKFLNLAEIFDKRCNFSKEHRLLFKYVLRFSSLERILKDESKINTLSSYYEDLKRRVPWLKNDPHYWLQYGMAQLAHKRFEKARKFFATAYSLAERKANYYTDQIDTQQARLYLQEYLEADDSNGKFEWFENAHRLLINLDDTRYKFKQIDLYRDVLDAHYNRLSKAKKTKLKAACLFIINSDPQAQYFAHKEQDFIDRIVHRLKDAVKPYQF